MARKTAYFCLLRLQAVPCILIMLPPGQAWKQSVAAHRLVLF